MALAVVMPYDNQWEIPEPLVIGSFTEITGSLSPTRLCRNTARCMFGATS